MCPMWCGVVRLQHCHTPIVTGMQFDSTRFGSRLDSELIESVTSYQPGHHYHGKTELDALSISRTVLLALWRNLNSCRSYVIDPRLLSLHEPADCDAVLFDCDAVCQPGALRGVASSVAHLTPSDISSVVVTRYHRSIRRSVSAKGRM